MPWKVEYVPERATVVVNGSGEMRNEDARAQIAEAIGLLKENEASGVLVDYSEAQSEMSLPELYWLPDYARELGMPWNARVAVVLPRMRYRVESYQFFVLVLRNAGYEAKLFEERGAAEDWLAASLPARRRAAHWAAA